MSFFSYIQEYYSWLLLLFFTVKLQTLVFSSVSINISSLFRYFVPSSIILSISAPGLIGPRKYSSNPLSYNSLSKNHSFGSRALKLISLLLATLTIESVVCHTILVNVPSGEIVQKITIQLANKEIQSMNGGGGGRRRINMSLPRVAGKFAKLIGK